MNVVHDSANSRFLFLRWIGFGLVLHGLLLSGLGLLPEKVSRPAAVEPIPVSIFISKKIQPNPKAMQESRATSSPTRAPESPAPRPMTDPQAQDTTSGKSRQTYEKLLPSIQGKGLALPAGPDNSNKGSFAQHQWNYAYSSKQKQDLILEAGSLAALFDVPLVVRKIGLNRKAFVRLFYDRSQSTLWIKSLDGDPMLRAALYEPLQQVSVQKIIRRLIETVPGQTVTIHLQVRGDAVQKSDIDQSFQWQGSQLFISKAAPAATPSGGGWPLPDEEAARAIRRDQVHRDRLIQSPAFKAPLAEFLLCRAC